jgi:hypothetical protein
LLEIFVLRYAWEYYWTTQQSLYCI